MGILTCIYLNAVSHLGVKSPFCVQHYFVSASLSYGHISSYFYYAAQVLITSDVSGQLWNSCVWNLNTGASLTSYKGESTNHHGLCVLGGQYLLGASCSKPLIHVWALQRRVNAIL